MKFNTLGITAICATLAIGSFQEFRVKILLIISDSGFFH